MKQITFDAKLGNGANRLFPLPTQSPESIDAILNQGGMRVGTRVEIQVQGKQEQKAVDFKGAICKDPMSNYLRVGYHVWPATELGPEGYTEGQGVTVKLTRSQP